MPTQVQGELHEGDGTLELVEGGLSLGMDATLKVLITLMSSWLATFPFISGPNDLPARQH
jgi:hypothetical protein